MCDSCSGLYNNEHMKAVGDRDGSRMRRLHNGLTARRACVVRLQTAISPEGLACPLKALLGCEVVRMRGILIPLNSTAMHYTHTTESTLPPRG